MNDITVLSINIKVYIYKFKLSNKHFVYQNYNKIKDFKRSAKES